MTLLRIVAALLLFALALAPGFSHAQDVVAVVSAKSPISAIGPGQLADIFLGKATRLPDGTPAVAIDQQEDSPVRDRFYVQLTGKSPAQVKAHWSKIIFTGRGQPPKQYATGAEARKAIADNPNAIGYLETGLVDESVRVLALR